jgi:mono/diheme cytochrome c family protein
MPFDDDLYRTIAFGIPVGGMPRNTQLEPTDRWALVAYVKSLAVFDRPDGRRENHFETKAPGRRWTATMPDDADPVRGRDLFQRGVGCASCHGMSGKGDGPAAAGLVDAWERPAPAPDLTRGDLTFKTGSRPEDLYRVLALGMAGTPMPSFASLPEKDRRDLVAHVRSLLEPIPAGERLFLSAGCTACHTIGRGKHVGPDLIDVGSRRDRAWLRRWLADPPGVLARDPETRKQFQDYRVVMPNFQFGAGEIDSLVDYLQGLNAAPGGK